jgi:hypothetical protein
VGNLAKNDLVLVDSILQQRLAEGLPSRELGEVFEYFALEQVLKDFDLSRDELERGWIDGRDDGGIDAFFVFVNGHFVQEIATFAWPKTGAVMEVWILTCKHHSTFEQAPIDSILASAQELFDLSLNRDELKGSYSDDLLGARELLAHAYRRISMARPRILFNFCYVSRGNTDDLGASVLARSRQLCELIGSFFSDSSVRFDFVGATQLVSLFRQTKQFSLDLPFIEHVSAGIGSYILLARLDDYWRFVSDETGNLRRYLFDSNVRDFLRGTRVNDDIAESLRTESAPDFWWLNNGVTILATNAALSGKTISLQNIQIVNGLQTTEAIYRYFQHEKPSAVARTLLVKALVSTDALVRDRIIRATNNQNAVELASLHATDKIQRDIEDILEKHDWFYERRKNYYRNIGKPPQRFVTPMYLASCVVSLVFKNPASAAKLKNRFMRNPTSYNSVFSEDFPLDLWPALVGVTKKVEETLSVLRSQNDELGDRFLAKWRGLVSLISVARTIGTFDYAIHELVQMNLGAITPELITDIWQPIQSLMAQPSLRRAFRKQQFVLDQCDAAAAAHDLEGVACVGKRQIQYETVPLDEIFVAAVSKLLSELSADNNADKTIAKRMGCSRSKVKSAIYTLRKRGIFVDPPRSSTVVPRS